ncbi:hypothetical protein [Phenylobacterium sp.]|uniref:hypothetical protein n=1 Tax=Phenylobacterium sp. TaxID=1871053 RepID=UPI0035B48785
MWLFLGALFLVVVIAAAISDSSKRNEEAREKVEKSRLAEMRAKAYADYLKRTSTRPDIAAMTDDELSEHVFDAIRTFNKKREELTKGMSALAGIVIITTLVVAFVVLADGPKQGALLIGFMAFIGIFAMHASESEKIASAYVAKGFEIERLKIES